MQYEQSARCELLSDVEPRGRRGPRFLGVVPLAVAVGTGAEMRQSLGTAVFAGMLGVTLFGLVFTPVFYVLVRKVGLLTAARRPSAKVDVPAE